MMPPRRLIQHLLRPGDEALPQPSTIQNQPPTQNLPGIAEGREHAIFTDIEKVELQHATNINTSATVIGSSQNSGSVDSTQTNGGVLHQSPPRASSPIQVIQEHAEFEQHQVEDWKDEVSEDKPQKKQSLLEFNKRLKGSVKNRKPSPEGRQQLSMPKLEDNTLIEKGQNLQSSSMLLTPFTNRNRGKSLRWINHTTNPTPTHNHLHLCPNANSTTLHPPPPIFEIY
jgi:hypothetical protein